MTAADPGVYVLRHGTRAARRSEVFLGHGLVGDPDGPIDVDYFLWAVVTENGIVVVDTGFGPDAARRRGRTVLHDPVVLLGRTLGVDAADVDTVVLTHAHYDHAGNLTRLPNARVVVGAAELAFLRDGALAHPVTGHFIEPAEAETLLRLADEGRLDLVTEDVEIVPGVTVIPSPGHTPGQLMVQVAPPEVLLASDALHFAEELALDLPFASTMDVPAAYAAFDRIRSLAAAGAVVVPGHDRVAFEALERISPDVAVIRA